MVKHIFPTFPFFPPKKEMYIGEKITKNSFGLKIYFLSRVCEKKISGKSGKNGNQ